MTTEPLRVERRVGQRFDFHVPLAVKACGSEQAECGVTQDLSSRGCFFYLDSPIAASELIELTFLMPSEITLGESMPVRCHARVVRVVPPSVGTKLGVAVLFEGYEYLTEPKVVADPPDFDRVSALHGRSPGSELHTEVSISRRA